jgi:hypothetical protein
MKQICQYSEDNLIVTKHAYTQAKKRLGIKASSLKRLLPTIFNRGVIHANTVSQLNKFISRKHKLHPYTNNIRVYGENIFFFTDNRLITLYRLPNNLIKYIKHCG